MLNMTHFLSVVLGVIVLSTPANAGRPLMRIRDGSETAGRVEIRKEDTWGTPCGYYSNWGYAEAYVVCTYLGFNAASEFDVDHYAAHGYGSGPIYMSNVQCSGTERTLWDCPHSTSACFSHFYDVSVFCAAPGGTGCLDEPPCAVPDEYCIYAVTENVDVEHQRCPICRCRSCPKAPKCPSLTKCKSGETMFYDGKYCKRCKCVPLEIPEFIEEPNSISLGLMVAVVVVMGVIPAITLSVTVIYKKQVEKKMKAQREAKAKERRAKDTDAVHMTDAIA